MRQSSLDTPLPYIHEKAQVRMSAAVLWGILLCCVTATTFIVRLTGQVETLAREMVQAHAEMRDLREQQVNLLRELDAIKRR